ncbi:MAG: hypothetical protein AAF560_27570 [Acidobacteriota bacterium]
MKARDVVLFSVVILAALLSSGCRVLVPIASPLQKLFGKEYQAERYRMVGIVCDAASEVREESGILLGVELHLAKLGEPCGGATRRAFVSVGRPSALSRARRLHIQQRVYVVGTLDGSTQQTVMVQRLKGRR